MTKALISHVIPLMPVILTCGGWSRVFAKRHTEPLCPLAYVLLASVTLLALFAAGTFIYFEIRPEHLPPWQSAEVMTFGSFLLLGPASVLVSLLALGRAPICLFCVLELTSVWLTGLGLLASAAF